MLASDPWEIGVDPAQELTSAFSSNGAYLTVWKASGDIIAYIENLLSRRQAAVEDLKSMALEFNARLIYSGMDGYEFYFDKTNPAPEGWQRYTRSDGKPSYEPPDRKTLSRLEEINEAINALSDAPRAAQNYIISIAYSEIENNRDFRDKTRWEAQKALNNLPKDWIKGIEKLDSGYYLVASGCDREIPGCERVKLSDFFRMKEEAEAKTAPPAPAGSSPAAPGPG